MYRLADLSLLLEMTPGFMKLAGHVFSDAIRTASAPASSTTLAAFSFFF